MVASKIAYGGIDLGGTKIQAVVTSEDYTIAGECRRPTPTTGGPADVVAEMAAAMHEAAAAAGLEPADLVGVGVGAPGAADFASGTLSHAPNLPDWEGSYPLGPALSERLGAPVFVGNDVGVAVDAEFELGAGEPYTSMVGIWWGTGVGGGLIFNGQHWSGRGAAGEIGHMVIRAGGRPEPKGLVGTIEAYAGRAAMEARARELVRKGQKTELFKIMERKGRARLASGVWAKALEKGDPMAVKLIQEAIDALGEGAASVVNLLDVEALVIGGGLGTRLGQPYADRIAEAMKPHLLRPEQPPVVLTTALGDLGGAIGGALLAATSARQKHAAPLPVA